MAQNFPHIHKIVILKARLKDIDQLLLPNKYYGRDTSKEPDLFILAVA